MPNDDTNITYITDTDTIKLVGNLKLDTDTKIEIHLPAAKNDVINLIGETKYAELVALETTDDNRKLASLGEANFVMAYAAPQLNNVSTGAGFTKAEGFGDGRTEYLNESDIERMIERYRAEAVRLLEKFVTRTHCDKTLDVGGLQMAAI